MGGKVCDSYCTNCVYYVGYSDTGLCCNYYIATDKRRPCDPGKGCTVRVLRKKSRRTRKDRYIESGK